MYYTYINIPHLLPISAEQRKERLRERERRCQREGMGLLEYQTMVASFRDAAHDGVL
jgi:hypothetical protein